MPQIVLPDPSVHRLTISPEPANRPKLSQTMASSQTGMSIQACLISSIEDFFISRIEFRSLQHKNIQGVRLNIQCTVSDFFYLFTIECEGFLCPAVRQPPIGIFPSKFFLSLGKHPNKSIRDNNRRERTLSTSIGQKLAATRSSLPSYILVD